jgi:protoporphyrinogen oxidase
MREEASMSSNNTSSQEIAIIGAGVAGMSAAWDLLQAGYNVTLYEAGERVGGLAAGFRDEKWDWDLEKFYHHWFEGDKDLLGLAEEMGVRDKVIFPRPKTSFWIDGDIVRSEIDPISVLRLPLSPLGLVRFAMGGAFVKLTPDWRSLERVTADAWMRRWMGEEGYDKFFRPLLIGKFGDYYDKVNMAWMWARVKARSLRLGTYTGGFQAFMDELARQLEAKGATIHVNTPVQHVAPSDDGTVTLTVNDEKHTYYGVISTTSPRLMRKLTPALADTPYAQKMDELKSIGGLCVVFALKQSLMTDGTYWLNLPAQSPDYRDNEFPFLALVEHTNYMDKAHYGGDTIVYAGDYVAPDHEYFSMSEDELIAHYLPALKKVNPDFDESWVRKSWVWRAPYAQPVPLLNHSENIPALRTPLKGVYWASMSQVYPWDRGTNFAVEIGRRVAGQLLSDKR